MDGLLIPGIVAAIRSKVDGSLSLTIETQELSAPKAGELFSFRGKVIMVYLSPKDTISQKEIDQVNAIDADVERKTPSKRMRDVLYVLFTQQPEGHREFETFYKSKMSRYIDEIKSNLQ